MIAPKGDRVYVSGWVALDSRGNVIAAGNMQTQARRVFDQIRKILEECDDSVRNVVEPLASGVAHKRSEAKP